MRVRGCFWLLVLLSSALAFPSAAHADTINRVLHLDHGRMVEYKGTYSQYIGSRAKDEERLAKQRFLLGPALTGAARAICWATSRRAMCSGWALACISRCWPRPCAAPPLEPRSRSSVPACCWRQFTRAASIRA